MDKISINLETIATNDYDNKGAYETLQAMMKRNERLSVRFGAGIDRIPCAWIESRDVVKFKYQLKTESLKGLLHYLLNGEATEFDSNPEDTNTVDENMDFEKEVMLALVKKGLRLQFTPLFRENTGSVSAILAVRKGKVFFKTNRTPELLDELREYKQAV